MVEMKTDLIGMQLADKETGEIVTVHGVRPADDNPIFINVLIEWENGAFGTYPLYRFISKRAYDEQMDREMEEEQMADDLKKSVVNRPWWKLW